jgi:predicted small metal-binding protein
MQVIDCDRCGETVRGADNDELARNLVGHYRAEHDEELSSEDAEELVAEEGYAGLDS